MDNILRPIGDVSSRLATLYVSSSVVIAHLCQQMAAQRKPFIEFLLYVSFGRIVNLIPPAHHLDVQRYPQTSAKGLI